MAKHIVQVPIESELLGALNEFSRSRQVSRSAVIRDACRQYLRDAEVSARDRAYEDGYRRVPEDVTIAETQVVLVGEILAAEDW
jgi:metal-responsive CopG/Arc/MetJ family transcriptional regulator